MKLKKVYIMIPTLNPTEDLIDYIKHLKEKGFNDILVINDGSNKEKQPIFDAIENIDGCKILTHAINLGKGRAMKNGFNFFLNLKNLDEYSGMIAVDSDGQHSVEDVEKIAKLLETTPDSLIMGSRNFDGKDVPIKSSFGNKMTCLVFKLLYGQNLKDTQTGLRGFPTNIIYNFMDLFGERFEYETSMLIECALKKIDIKEVDIQTIYIDNNSETHFRPIKDSLAIYNIILKSFIMYMCSSLMSFFIDIGMFSLFMNLFKYIGFRPIKDSLAIYNIILKSFIMYMCSSLMSFFIDIGMFSLFMNLFKYIGGVGKSILIATVAARIISSLFNYTVNKNVVFKNTDGKSTLVKYYILCITQMLLSAGIVELIYSYFAGGAVLIKVVVDSILFILSYQIQQRWVFKESK